MGKAKTRKQKKISNLFKEIDLFGEQIVFQIKGADSYKSVLGAIISVVVITIVLAYGYNKFQIMKNFEGTDYQTITNAKALNSTERFENAETHVNVAFGLVDIERQANLLPEEYDGMFEWEALRWYIDLNE